MTARGPWPAASHKRFIDELVARSDIVEIIGARVPLKKAGREYKACCPFHSEKTPSFWVSPDKQFYHCFGCGAHGTVVGFLMQYEKLEFPDAVADLAERAGLEMPREAQGGREPGGGDLYELMAARVAILRAESHGQRARARLSADARHRRARPSAKFALGYAPDSWNALLTRFGPDEDERRRLLQAGLIIERDARGGERQTGFYDRFRDRLMFPIRDSRGRVLAFGGRIIDRGEPKYLNSPETPLFHKGRELYGLYEARQARTDFKRLMIVEGYMDVVRLHQAGITLRGRHPRDGDHPGASQQDFPHHQRSGVLLRRRPRRTRRRPGARSKTRCRLARDGRELKFMFLPEGDDPDTLVAAEGPTAFEARMKGALPLSEYLVKQLSRRLDLAHVDGRAKLAALASTAVRAHARRRLSGSC